VGRWIQNSFPRKECERGKAEEGHFQESIVKECQYRFETIMLVQKHICTRRIVHSPMGLHNGSSGKMLYLTDTTVNDEYCRSHDIILIVENSNHSLYTGYTEGNCLE
jgi:hypothetical protein